MNIVIEPLSRHPELVPVAARWHWSEWGHTDPGGTLESWTAALGHDTLYLFTERGSAAQSLYERLSWQPADAARYEGIDVTVMRTSLPGAARAPAARAAGRGAARRQR